MITHKAQGLIESQWLSYLADVVPTDAGEAQREETEFAYYAGAAALFHTIMNILEPGAEPTAGDLRTMESIDAELKAHIARVVRKAVPKSSN